MDAAQSHSTITVYTLFLFFVMSVLLFRRFADCLCLLPSCAHWARQPARMLQPNCWSPLYFTFKHILSWSKKRGGWSTLPRRVVRGPSTAVPVPWASYASLRWDSELQARAFDARRNTKRDRSRSISGRRSSRDSRFGREAVVSVATPRVNARAQLRRGRKRTLTNSYTTSPMDRSVGASSKLVVRSRTPQGS